MKKGFTLVELLGVIVILGIISILVVPVVNNMMIESREDLAEAQKKAILKAAKNWGSANMFILPDCDGNATCEDDVLTITLGQLMNEGFLDNQTIKDVNNDKIYSLTTEITIGKKNNQHVYELATNNLYEDENIITEGGPTIVLSGSSAIVVEANRDGRDFEEPGVMVRDKDGNEISDYKVTVTKISEKGESITPQTETMGPGYTNFGFDTKTVAKYKITYEAISDGKTAKMIRNIQVRDTTAPTISFVNNIEVAQSVQKREKMYSDVDSLREKIVFINPSFSSEEANIERSNVLSKISGVAVMDNTCGEKDMKKVTIKSDVPSDGTLGSYSITYTVTDKYGNKTSKVRNVKIVSG